MIHCIVWTSLKCSQTLSYHYSGGTQGHGLDKIMNFVNYNNQELIIKEGKRVSNALYGLCKMFSESHAPGIQILTNQSARFK